MTDHLSTQHITEILKVGCLTNNRNLFLTVVEAGSPTLRYSTVEFWWSPSCSLYNDTAHHILTRQRAEGESKLFCDLQELWSHSPPWSHLILVTSQRPSLLIPSHDRDRLSTYELGRGKQAFSSQHKIFSTKSSRVMNEVKIFFPRGYLQNPQNVYAMFINYYEWKLIPALFIICILFVLAIWCILKKCLFIVLIIFFSLSNFEGRWKKQKKIGQTTCRRAIKNIQTIYWLIIISKVMFLKQWSSLTNESLTSI